MNSYLTSDFLFRPATLPQTNAPLRIAARQMRWFRAAFASYVDRLGEELGCEFAIDTTRLGTAFVHWLRTLERERRGASEGRREYIDFAASVMLQHLVANMPLAAKKSVSEHVDERATFWPEGYVLTHFCLLVHRAVVAQEYDSRPTIDKKIDEIDFWWTFRENAIEDDRLAAGFFQVLLGYRPSWIAPNYYGHFSKAVRV